MKLGMPVLYEFDSVKENMELAKKLGLDFVEWNLNFSYCRDALEQKGYIKQLVDEYKLDITLHFYDEADFGIYPEVAGAYLKLLKRYLALGKGYIKNLNIHLIEGPIVTISGVKNYIYEKEFPIYIKRLLDFLKKVDNLCNKYNCNLVIENSKTLPYMTKTYAELEKYGFKFTYDIGHDKCNNEILFNYQKDKNMNFAEFHFHDADGTKDHLSLGKGTINLKYFKELAIKNDAYVLLEVKSSSDLAESIKVFHTL